MRQELILVALENTPKLLGPDKLFLILPMLLLLLAETSILMFFGARAGAGLGLGACGAVRIFGYFQVP